MDRSAAGSAGASAPHRRGADEIGSALSQAAAMLEHRHALPMFMQSTAEFEVRHERRSQLKAGRIEEGLRLRTWGPALGARAEHWEVVRWRTPASRHWHVVQSVDDARASIEQLIIELASV